MIPEKARMAAALVIANDARAHDGIPPIQSLDVLTEEGREVYLRAGGEAVAAAIPHLESVPAADADLLEAAKNAAATISAIYQWLERVESAGGATSVTGVAQCHAMLTSLRKNAGRTETLIMAPLRKAISAAAPASEPRAEVKP